MRAEEAAAAGEEAPSRAPNAPGKLGQSLLGDAAAGTGPEDKDMGSYFKLLQEGKKFELMERTKERVFQQALMDMEARSALNAQGKVR